MLGVYKVPKTYYKSVVISSVLSTIKYSNNLYLKNKWALH